MKDKMTPLERSRALKEGKEVDRFPISISHATVAPKLIGMSYREAFSSAENIAKKEINAYREWNLDNVLVNYGLMGLGSALGTKLQIAEYSAPVVERFAITKLEEYSDLPIDKIRLNNNEELQKHYEAIEIIYSEIGSEVGISYAMAGPLTSAVSLIPLEKLLRYSRKESKLLHEFLSFVTESICKVIDDFSKLGFLTFSFSDPVATGSILSPKQYEEFVVPYTRTIVNHVHQYQSSVSIHICGDTTKVLEYIPKTNTNSFSIDNVVDLEVAKNKIGSKLKLIGNVDPIRYFLNGDPEEMDQQVLNCFKKAWDSPKGFCIGSGCSVPYHTPIINIESYLTAAKKYSAMMLDKERFKEFMNNVK